MSPAELILVEHIQGVLNSEAVVLGILSQGASIPHHSLSLVPPSTSKNDAVQKFGCPVPETLDRVFCLIHKCERKRVVDLFARTLFARTA